MYMHIVNVAHVCNHDVQVEVTINLMTWKCLNTEWYT